MPGLIPGAGVRNAPLSAPVLLASGELSGTLLSITSGSVSPKPHSLIACVLGSRDSAQADCEFSYVDTTIDIVADSYEFIQPAAQFDTGSSRYIGNCIALFRVSATPGSDSIEFFWTGSVFNLLYHIYEIPSGFVLNASTYPRVTGGSEATPLALNLAGAPAANSLILSSLVELNNVSGSFTVPSGHTELAQVTQGGNLDSKASYKLGSGAQNNSWTGLDPVGHAGVLVEILHA